MYKRKPKKKKVLAPTTQKLRELREEEFNKAMEKSHKFFQTMKKIEEEKHKAKKKSNG